MCMCVRGILDRTLAEIHAASSNIVPQWVTECAVVATAIYMALLPGLELICVDSIIKRSLIQFTNCSKPRKTRVRIEMGMGCACQTASFVTVHVLVYVLSRQHKWSLARPFYMYKCMSVHEGGVRVPTSSNFHIAHSSPRTLKAI